jgi:hypothetical protein
MATENHTGLAKISPDGRLVMVVYYNSKFAREIGDRITYEGTPMVVAVVEDTRNKVIMKMNQFISYANAGLKFKISNKNLITL